MPDSLGPSSPLVEREIKLRLASDEGGGLERAELRRRVVSADALLTHERGLEDNVLFDRLGELRQRGIVLRLRTYGAADDATLTYKGPPSFEGDHKIREEVDLGCASAFTAAAFLEGLGYRKTARYQKFREVWRLEDDSGLVEVCIDETPIGDFVEVELISSNGDSRRSPIDATRERLGLEDLAAEKRSYLGLYADYRTRHPEAPAEMLFREQETAES